MRPAGLTQPIFAGLVAGVTGFASSFALLIAGLRNVGATDGQAASGLLVLCVVPGLITVVLSTVHRIPISIVWSTPAAALLLASEGTDDFRSAVGAFLLCGVLLVITGLWPWLARTVTRIPKPIASAMLAGILFPICLAPVLPGFDPAIVLGLGIPIYLVTMAGQNVPGFAVLRTFGYEHPPARAIFVGTGVGNLVAAPFGGIALNLAAITAAMAAGPDAHPDRDKRWIAAVAAGGSLAVLGLLSGLATVLVAASPPILITAVAGLALFGALVSAVTAALEEPAHRLVAIITFLVAVSGLSIAGIGSAFWALLVGGLVMLWFLPWRRKHHPEVVSE